MALVLKPHVHLVVLGDDVVLLDTVADAYLCVPDGVAQLRPTPDHGAVAPADAAVAAALAEAGLVDAERCAVPRTRLIPPQRDIGGPLSARLSWRERAALAGALWDLAWRYRGRSLSQILRFVTDAPHSPVDDGADEVLRLARLFQRVAVWLPIPRKCLVRSFVLLRFLQRSGLQASWVFGVATWPFAAHCWLQLDDLVLDDHAERIVEYEPILGVG